MSAYSVDSPSLAAAVQDRSQRSDRDHTPAVPSRVWALLQALAYAGACIDLSGVLAAQRLHRRAATQALRTAPRPRGTGTP